MKRILLALFLVTSATAAAACKTTGSADAKPESSTSSPSPGTVTRRTDVGANPGNVGKGTPLVAQAGHELAAFAGGCFWGVEDTFRQVPGVTATAVGYTGGKTESPTYEAVCSHTTGHAETVLVEYEPSKISYEQLLNVFFANHDPTTFNRQGPDVGDQYRSNVFTFSDAQAEKARAKIASEEKARGKKLATRVDPIPRFWKAEEYHQQYDEKTGTHSCPLPKGLPKST